MQSDLQGYFFNSLSHCLKMCVHESLVGESSPEFGNCLSGSFVLLLVLVCECNPPAVWGPDQKNCLGVVMVNRMTFTWYTNSFDFWPSSSPNREGDTSSKLESSSTKGSRALFICIITLVRLRWLIQALALPRNLIVAVTAARVFPPVFQ